MELFFQAAGWIGMAIILTTYYQVTVGRWGTRTKIDEVANLVGSVLIAVNVYHYGAWPAFALNVAWGAIALLNLAKKRNPS
jgi:uncharacterized membrane protein